MSFLRFYLGLAAVDVVLTLLGWSVSGFLRLASPSSASEHQVIRTGPRHRRDVDPPPTVRPRSTARLTQPHVLRRPRGGTARGRAIVGTRMPTKRTDGVAGADATG